MHEATPRSHRMDTHHTEGSQANHTLEHVLETVHSAARTNLKSITAKHVSAREDENMLDVSKSNVGYVVGSSQSIFTPRRHSVTDHNLKPSMDRLRKVLDANDLENQPSHYQSLIERAIQEILVLRRTTSSQSGLSDQVTATAPQKKPRGNSQIMSIKARPTVKPNPQPSVNSTVQEASTKSTATLKRSSQQSISDENSMFVTQTSSEVLTQPTVKLEDLFGDLPSDLTPRADRNQNSHQDQDAYLSNVDEMYTPTRNPPKRRKTAIRKEPLHYKKGVAKVVRKSRERQPPSESEYESYEAPSECEQKKPYDEGWKNRLANYNCPGKREGDPKNTKRRTRVSQEAALFAAQKRLADT